MLFLFLTREESWYIQACLRMCMNVIRNMVDLQSKWNHIAYYTVRRFRFRNKRQVMDLRWWPPVSRVFDLGNCMNVSESMNDINITIMKLVQCTYYQYPYHIVLHNLASIGKLYY